MKSIAPPWIQLPEHVSMLQSLTRPGICLPDLRTRASGSMAECCLPRGISDITSELGTNPTDGLPKNISAKSDSESSGSVSSAPSNPPQFPVRRGVIVLAFTLREVWAVPQVQNIRRVRGTRGAPHFAAVAEDSGWLSSGHCGALVQAFAVREVWAVP